jgi:hypothetical protein
MWIIGLAEGGLIGPFPSERSARAYRDEYLSRRVANIHRVERPTFQRSL